MEIIERKIKTVYLVDFENTHDAGMVGYDNLDSNDEIIIFYTVFNKVKPSYGMSNCNVQYELVSEGKQSVDMHIISYIGYMAGVYGEKCNIVIISIDRGYDRIIKYWRNKTNINIIRRQSITAKKIDSKERLVSEIFDVLDQADYCLNDINDILDAVIKYSGNKDIRHNVKEYLYSNYSNVREVVTLIDPILVQYLRDMHGNIKGTLRTNLNNKIVQILSKEKYPEDIKYKTVSIVLENMYDDNIRKVVYKELISEYGQQDGLEIYGLIRDVI